MILGSTASIPETPTYHLVLCRVGTRTYGIALDQVREIIPFRPATRLPGAPPYVCGLINLRGTIVTVIDVGVRLDGAPAGRVSGSVVLVDYGSRLVGLAVDEALEVPHLAEVDVEPTAPDGDSGAIVRAVGRLRDTVVILLDAGEIIRQVLL
jgi:purine-binding chemotaxis protein CheW